ncbi:alpha-L-rhamnosidase [Actinopolymorpha pittospori]|uniref:alpha-L-rhamnosidase n=1 Tax=Actinopolymorpha pittospori TaxID=648752 RepID=A0A927MUC2_9ACTN|nr:alpha-L-rhamnosidase [Actinopolymorpha pittospori]MBE1606789.1 alpha-L-rhamnosidase [Actinopolymorpha pittospori]
MSAVLSPHTLRTEYADNPLGIDEPRPRFSWLLRSDAGSGESSESGQGAFTQTSYQVIVSSDLPGLEAGRGDVWDSGRVESSGTGQVEYDGAPLRPATGYVWSVRVWDGAGEASDWAAPAAFETGLLSSEDWGGAVWVRHPAATGTDGPAPSPLLRKTFQLPPGDIVRARLHACGLGFGEFHLDGERVGRAVLDPAPTNYEATVLYSTHDVTPQVRAGASSSEHVLAVALGRGRYADPTPNVWYWQRAPWWDDPKLLAHLVVSYADGRVERVVSDLSWRAVDGPTRVDSLYAGEVYDAAKTRRGWTSTGFDDSDWSDVVAATPPRGVLRSQQVEPIEVIGELEPVGLAEPQPGVHVYDLGQQLAGWARLRVVGPAGTRLRIRYGERLLDDGTVDIRQVHIDGDMQTDTFVLSGEGYETFEPRFSYKGFQYVQVDGHPGRPDIDDLRAQVVHTAVASTGEFETDNRLVNRIHTATRWAVLNNLHGVPTDTPVFEKNGWTGDAHLTANVAAYNFHMPRFYTKWLQDWVDAQLPTGEFPPIVPTSGWGYHGDPDAGITGPIPAWDVAYAEIPWVMYQHYGDERILARHYDGQRRYLDHLVDGYLRDDVVLVGLGDWLPPGVHGMPPEGPGVYETAYTLRFVELLGQIGQVLGRQGDLAGYDELAGRIRSGFDRAFFDAAAGIYHGERPTDYRQSVNVVALAFGLVPDDRYAAVLDRLVADIHERDDHLDTGVIGTKFLLPLLTRHGMVDLAFRVATRLTYPGYGFWMEQGATALYEHWHAGSRSRNHHFFGHVDQWFIEDLAGLTPAEPGFARVRVRPSPPSDLGRARAALDTVRGRVATSWERRGEGVAVTVELPPGVSGEVHVPGAGVQECGPGTHTFES